MALPPRPCLVADLVTRTPWSERRNRFYFTSDTPLTGLSDVEACCNNIFVTYATLYKKLTTTQVQHVRVEGRWYGGGTSELEGNSTLPEMQGELSAVTPGSESDEEDITPDTLPDEVSLIIQKRTGNSGRNNRGRWFFCGLGESVQNAGIIDVAMYGPVKTFANKLSDNITVSGAFSTVLHARHFDQKGGELDPITKCYAIRVLGTRKDRRSPLKLERL